MNLRQHYLNSKEENKTAFSTFRKRVEDGENPDEAIKTRVRRYKWKTMKEIMEYTWKSYSAIHQHFQRHPDCSIDDIKNANKDNNNRKHYIDGVPLKEYTKKHWFSYSWFLHFIKKWMSLEDIVLYYKNRKWEYMKNYLTRKLNT